MSLVDMYIDNSEPSENVGQIHFSLEYDFQNTTLILRIIQVRETFTLESTKSFYRVPTLTLWLFVSVPIMGFGEMSPSGLVVLKPVPP